MNDTSSDVSHGADDTPAASAGAARSARQRHRATLPEQQARRAPRAPPPVMLLPFMHSVSSAGQRGSACRERCNENARVSQNPRVRTRNTSAAASEPMWFSDRSSDVSERASGRAAGEVASTRGVSTTVPRRQPRRTGHNEPASGTEAVVCQRQRTHRGARFQPLRPARGAMRAHTLSEPHTHTSNMAPAPDAPKP